VASVQRPSPSHVRETIRRTTPPSLLLSGECVASTHTVYQGIAAGAVAGLVGTWAMSELQRLWTHVVDGDPPVSAGGRHDARDLAGAQRRSELERASRPRDRRLPVRPPPDTGRASSGSPLMHYLFGGAVGAIYGVYAERRHARRSGAAFGTTVWLAADEVAMPLLGLSDSTLRRPVEMHLQSLSAHLVYDTATELTRRSVRAHFDGAPPGAQGDGL
jgi:Protein of unknown function (DUF1440)